MGEAVAELSKVKPNGQNPEMFLSAAKIALQKSHKGFVETVK